MNDRFENKLNQFHIVNDLKKRANWVVHKRRTNEIELARPYPLKVMH